jgi:hypothetical protein
MQWDEVKFSSDYTVTSHGKCNQINSLRVIEEGAGPRSRR